MIPLKKTLLFTALLILQISLHAQNKNEEIAGEWRIDDVVKLNATQAVAQIVYDSKKEGVVLVNSSGKVEWEVTIPYHIIGIGKWKEHIIAFHTDGWERRNQAYNKVRSISATIIDLKSRSIISDKEIFANNTKYDILPSVQNDALGNFVHLTLNHISNDFYYVTKSVSLVYIQNDGTALTKELETAAIGRDFVKAVASKDGTTFIASVDKSSLIVEKYQNSSLVRKMEAPIEMSSNKAEFFADMELDPFTSNSVAFNITLAKSKKRFNVFYNFNFDNGKLYTTDEIVLKEHSFLGGIGWLKPSQILFTNDKIVMVKKVHAIIYRTKYNSSVTVRDFYGKEGVISVYDKQLHLLHEEHFEKFVASFLPPAVDLSGHIRNDKLYMLSTESKSFAKFYAFSYDFDLNSYKLNKRTLDLGAKRFNFVLSPRGTIWFDDVLIASKLYQAGFMPKECRTDFKRIQFEELGLLKIADQAAK